MNTLIRSALLLVSLGVSPLLLAQDAASTSRQPQGNLSIALTEGLRDLYEEDLEPFNIVLADRPDGMFINGESDGVLQLSSLNDLGVSFLAESSGGRPLDLTLGVWLPDVGLASDDEDEQQEREEKDPEKTWLDEETVLRQAYSGQIERAQLVRFYVRADKARHIIEQRQLEPFLAYPPEEDEEDAQAQQEQEDSMIFRPADATTEQNRAGEIREYDQGLLVLPSPQVQQANAVRAGVAEPVYMGGYR